MTREINRIIKFRAWDKEDKCWVNQNVVAPRWEDTPYFGALVVIGDKVLELRSNENLEWMQFTGLLDKNGKEIYEGDILNAITGHKNVVEWNETSGMWTLDGLQEFMMRLPDGAIFPVHLYSEVIGNIYENPDLLTN